MLAQLKHNCFLEYICCLEIAIDYFTSDMIRYPHDEVIISLPPVCNNIAKLLQIALITM